MSRQIDPTIFVLVLLVSLCGASMCLGAEPKSQQAPTRVLSSATRTKALPHIPLPLLPAEQAWIATFDAPPSAGGAMDAERVYVPIQPEQILAIDRATGVKVWSRAIQSAWPPLVFDDLLYVAARSAIHAIDPVTGNERWRAPFDRPLIAPLARAGTLLIGVLEPGEAVAFATDDGHLVWRRELGAPSRHSAVFDGERVVFALDDSRVLSLSAADGTRVWEQALAGTLNQPSVARNRIFVGSNDNYLYALETDHGRVAWKWRTGGDVIGASVDTRGGAEYASLDNVLRAVNRGNGNQRWIKEIPTRPALPPQTLGDGKAYDEIVVLTGVTSEIDAFEAKTGAPVGMYIPPSDLLGAPLIDPVLRPYQVAMVVITRDGRAIGLRPSAMMLPEPMNKPFTTELPGRHLDRERSPLGSGSGAGMPASP